MAAFLRKQGVEADVGPKKRYSTDANLGGLSHEAEDLESLETPCTIVEPVMVVWPQDAPDKVESVRVRIEKGRAVAINGREGSPVEILKQANQIAGRNGIWMRNALENRVIGTKSRGVYEAPGMELLGFCIAQAYQATMSKRCSDLFTVLRKMIAEHVYEGRYFDPSCRAAQVAVAELAEPATANVQVGLYKGNLFFQALTDCPASLYNLADSSMEASEGLNPASSQGYVEVQSVEARALARAGQIK